MPQSLCENEEEKHSIMAPAHVVPLKPQSLLINVRLDCEVVRATRSEIDKRCNKSMRKLPITDRYQGGREWEYVRSYKQRKDETSIIKAHIYNPGLHGSDSCDIWVSVQAAGSCTEKRISISFGIGRTA